MQYLRMCLNLKVLAVLGLAAIGIWAVAPNAFLAALPVLLIAACPLSMVVMMWGMSHKMHGNEGPAHSVQPVLPDESAPSHELRIAALKARESALNHEIAELERAGSQPRLQPGVVGEPGDGKGNL